MVQATHTIIFSDLDGSLLDHESYSWQAASEALREIRQHNIPLVLCSSKTYAEIHPLTQELQIIHPFIFENGCGIAIPENYFSGDVIHENIASYEIHYLSCKLKTIHDTLVRMNAEANYHYELFTTLDIERICELTGLKPEEAARAAERQCSEPLLWLDSDSALQKFSKALKQNDFNLLSGGRFHTVSGMSDKGRAIKWLLSEYQKHFGDKYFFTLGLGDSGNDVEMFKAVDRACLINNPHIDQAHLEAFPNIHKTTLIGPAGWNSSVLEFITNQLTKKQ